MIYTVYPRTAEDAVNLAALFQLCQGAKPVSGAHVGKQHRAALAESLEDAAACEVLRDGREIDVRPRSATSWVIEDRTDNADLDLARVIRAEMKAQKMTEVQLARAAGVSQSTVNYVINSNRSPRLNVLRKLLAGLKKDLHWFAKQMDAPPPQVTP